MLSSHQVEAAMRCDAARNGDSCHHAAAGHRVTAMQVAVCAATPSSWTDAVVLRSGADGWIALAPIHGDEILRVWHHADLGARLTPGEPVALHGRYGVLASGSERFSVLPVD